MRNRLNGAAQESVLLGGSDRRDPRVTPSSPVRRRSRRGLPAELALSVAIAVTTVLLLRLWGPGLSHALRGRLLLLRPELGLRDAAAVVIAAFALSTIPARVRRWAPVSAPLAAAQRRLTGVTRISPVVGLTAIVSVAAAVRVLLVRAETEPKVFPDEFIYTELAKNIAQHGAPLLRGHLEIGYSVLYPVFLSPAYRFASDGAAAFAAVKAMNAVVMALTAVPAYALARRVLPQGWSLGVAALVVLEPWMAYASLATTEALFLPAFAAFALALALMLERPTVRRQLLVLFGLAALVAIRPQGLVFAGSIAAAVVLKGLLAGSGHEVVREHAVVFGGFAMALLAVLIALAAGASLPAGKEAGPLLSVAYNPLGLAKWTLWNLAIYELGLGVVALAAFPLALRGLLRRSASERERSLGISALTLVAGLLASVAALSSSQYGLGILHERNLFYATPLVLVCLAHWLASGLQRPKRLALVSTAVAVILLAILPSHIVRITNNVDGPTAAWFTELEHETGWAMKGATLGIAAVGTATLLLARRPLGPILALVLAFVALTAPLDYSGALTQEQDHALAWVDHALPDGAAATLVHLGFSRPDQPCSKDADADQRTLVVWTEFFNARVNRVVHMSEEVPDQVTSPKVTVAPGGIVHENGRPFVPRYAVLDSRQPVVGQRLARFDLAQLGPAWQGGASLSLWKVHRPLGFLTHAQPLPPRANGQQC
jgi:hypothetical protein